MKESFFEKTKELLLNLGAFFLICTLIASLVCFVVYPAFSCTFVLMVVLTTISIVHWGYALVDFPGMAIVPYWELASGLYLALLAALHYLNWKGATVFELGWLTLATIALISTFVTFVVCLTLNRPRR